MKKIIIARTYELTEELDKQVTEVAKDCEISSAEAIKNMYEDIFDVSDLVLAEEEDVIIAIYEG